MWIVHVIIYNIKPKHIEGETKINLLSFIDDQ
jgi:hypothetical protein